MAIFASGDLTAPSMMDGFLSSGYIYDLNDYVCEKIARPASSFFLKDNEAPMSELEYAINDKLKDDAESKNIRDGALSREPVVNQTATKDYKHVLEELKADQQQSSSTPNSRIWRIQSRQKMRGF